MTKVRNILLGLGVALPLICVEASAGGAPDWATPEYNEAAEALIDYGYFLSPEYSSGVYYTSVVRPVEEYCIVKKTVTTFSEEGETLSVLQTLYDFQLVAPWSVSDDGVGTLHFIAEGDEAVFPKAMLEGGTFETMISQDVFEVEEADELPLLREAVTSLLDICVPDVG